MKKYYYANGQERIGPLTIEELKQAEIKPSTLIWYEGLDNWNLAVSLEELRELFPNNVGDNTQFRQKEKIPQKKLEDMQNMFAKPFSFEGRIRRTEYVISLFFYFVFCIIMDKILGSLEFVIIFLLAIPVLWFILAQGAKRCHDLNNNGFYQIFPFYILVMMFQAGDKGDNFYGPDPKN